MKTVIKMEEKNTQKKGTEEEVENGQEELGKKKKIIIILLKIDWGFVSNTKNWNSLLAGQELTRKLQEIPCQQRRETRIPYTFRIRYPEGSRFATFAYPVTGREREDKETQKTRKKMKKQTKKDQQQPPSEK